MKDLVFWSSNPATCRAQIYLSLRRAFPTIPAQSALDFARMVHA